jgi:hypothetical protein
MTSHRIASPAAVQAHPHRFRLNRAGILNVWQYDDQVFEFAGGRMLLRGANGAGKSKTLEMLLPFVLDGDKLRMTASGRHHTSLLWLMTDGYDGASRIGYLWVEFVRTTDSGEPEWVTCGIGIRASQSARTATTWYFTSPRRVGLDLFLEDGTGPLPRERCRATVAEDGHFFDSPRQYKQHVGETLFGLAGSRYDELLRLLYWLRQPQVGEDIEPGRLAEILSVALPELDDAAVRAAGGTLDELAAFGEQLARRRQAAAAMTAFAQLYVGYARGAAASRGAELARAHSELSRLDRDISRRTAELAGVAESISQNEEGQRAAAARIEQARQRRRDLEDSPEARSHREVLALGERARELAGRATDSRRHASAAHTQAQNAKKRTDRDGGTLGRDITNVAEAWPRTWLHSGSVGPLPFPPRWWTHGCRITRPGSMRPWPGMRRLLERPGLWWANVRRPYRSLTRPGGELSRRTANGRPPRMRPPDWKAWLRPTVRGWRNPGGPPGSRKNPSTLDWRPGMPMSAASHSASPAS